jgi:hypothetical protein
MRNPLECTGPQQHWGRLLPVAVFVAALVFAFAVGAQLRVTPAHAAAKDSCTPADTNTNSTVMTLDEHLYNCHPSTGNSLPTGGVIGTVPQGSNPGITGHWWNTVSVDGDTGSACQPSTKWLRGNQLNWFSASCTQAP